MIKVRLEVCLLDVQEPVLATVGEGVKENIACGHGALPAQWDKDNGRFNWRIFGDGEVSRLGHCKVEG